jgi:biofilm PGA synthesis N-glycosyltransferase PgaC
MFRRRIQYACTIGGLLLLLIVASVGLYRFMLNTRLDIPSGFLRVSMLILFGFLTLLILRYFCLLWFSYLSFLEDRKETSWLEPFVTVLVPAYNEGAVIQGSIRSLLELDYPRYEILVIDDGSSDDTYRRASAYAGSHGRTEVRVIHQENAGKAAALNTGIRDARGELVLCMDGDSALAPQTIRKAVRHFANPDIGAVAGNVKVVNRTNMLASLQALEYIEGLNMVRQAQAFFRTVNIIPGPIGVFRRSALLKIGGYETDTFAEDCDLTLRLLVEGWQIQYEPESIAYTEAPEELLDLLKQRYRWTRGILQALNKHRRLLVAPRRGFSVWFTLWYMIFEGVAWPIMNVFAHVLFVCIAANYGASMPLVIWYAQLTVLDVAAAIYCVLLEEERISLIPYAVLYRAFFALTIDVAKLFASCEEVLRFRMDWGKLERIGRI